MENELAGELWNNYDAEARYLTIAIEHVTEAIDEIVETRAWLDAHSMAVSLSVNELVLIIAQQYLITAPCFTGCQRPL